MPKDEDIPRVVSRSCPGGRIADAAKPRHQRAAQDDQDDDQDPPSRVARMNYTQGSVTFQPGGEGDWVTAVPNRPLTSGDNLWTDQDSRAEMHVGSTAIRLAPETSMTVLDLDDRTTQLRLSEGTLILRVRHLDDGDLVEVDTPNLAFNLQRTGEYRIDVDSNGDMTNVSVLSGRGEVTGGGYSYTVVAGQSARFSGTDQLNYDIAQLPRADDFDNWAFQRDHREDGAESANYVSPEMTGYEDLDDYGHWQYVGGYGTVWVPSSVASDWAPYRNGHWAYIESLGMDLGGRRALGLRALPLRTLGLCRKPLVLGAGAGCGQAGVCAGAGGFCRRSWNFDRRRPGRGLVPAGSWRSVHALLSGQPRVRGAGQRDQHRGERHSSDQRLQRVQLERATSPTSPT